MTIVRICDVETTGLPEDPIRAICEIGWVDLTLDTLSIGNPKTFFVNPGHPIPPHIRAIHHISDKDVAAAMPPDQAVAFMLKDLGPEDVLCAHHASFEQSFIDAGERRWICSWKCALRAWPDAISHGNQALRYILGFDEEAGFDPLQAMPPHRSLPDAYVTAHVLRRLLQLRPIERLIEISGEPGFLPSFIFGKHYGKTFKEVAATDKNYLEWIVDKSDLDQDVKFTAGWWLRKTAVPA